MKDELTEFLLYTTSNNRIIVEVFFHNKNIWLTQKRMAELFGVKIPAISKHLKNIFDSGELNQKSVVSILETTTKHGALKGKTQTKSTRFYNLDAIISVGYRVNSSKATQFRIWATERLKEYLLKGYAINKTRLAQKNQEVKFLKTGLKIFNRAIKGINNDKNREVFQIFSKGLQLLDDFDYKNLDKLGKTKKRVVYPDYKDYIKLIKKMISGKKSTIFGKLKDKSFSSSINQIKQGYANLDFYPSIEDKAANLLYFITKNHPFVDGNKRIAAACFVYFFGLE